MAHNREEFYQTIGATPDQESMNVFFKDSTINYDQIEQQNYICPLSHYGFLGVTGVDAKKFLQGQLTCNLNDISLEKSLLGAACTHKGRMYSSFRLIQSSDNQIIMAMHKSIAENTQKTLSKYIVFSKAELKNLSEQYIAIGISGPDLIDILQPHVQQLPTETGGVTSADDIHVIKINDNNRYEIWLPVEKAINLWQTLSQKCQPVSNTLWLLQDIRDGRGDVCAETIELFIPQMLNYDITEAVNFKKGCYTGQEIVARMQYRGKLKRHMYRGKVIHTDRLAPASNLYTKGQEQTIGNIVAAVALNDNLWEILFVVTDEAIDQNELYLAPTGDNKIQTLPLPYGMSE